MAGTSSDDRLTGTAHGSEWQLGSGQQRSAEREIGLGLGLGAGQKHGGDGGTKRASLAAAQMPAGLDDRAVPHAQAAQGGVADDAARKYFGTVQNPNGMWIGHAYISETMRTLLPEALKERTRLSTCTYTTASEAAKAVDRCVLCFVPGLLEVEASV